MNIRTLLLPVLYLKAPFPGLRDLLNCFRTEVELDGEQSSFNLQNIQSSFEGLLNVFEKQVSFSRLANLQHSFVVL